MVPGSNLTDVFFLIIISFWKVCMQFYIVYIQNQILHMIVPQILLLHRFFKQ
jgi:hypothetical protein